MRPPWVGAPGACSPVCASVALLTATARGMATRFPCHRPMYASSSSPERGNRAFGGNIRACVFTAGTSTAITGAWPSSTNTASAWVGVHDGDRGPFRRPSENG